MTLTRKLRFRNESGVNMKIAFWNVGGMGASSDKLAVFKKWRDTCKPDILFLEELSHTLDEPDIAGANTRVIIAKIDNKHGEATTKNLGLVVGNSLTFDATSKGLPGQRAAANERVEQNLIAANVQARDCLYLILTLGGTKYRIFGLHANASSSGGNTAFDCMEKEVTMSSTPMIAGGDFNSTKDSDSGQVVKLLPKNHEGNELAFTQWNKQDKNAQFSAASASYDAAAHKKYIQNLYLEKIPELEKKWTKEVKPNAVLDYILHNKSVKDIKAEKNCADAEEWFSILREFDHCPVVYSFG